MPERFLINKRSVIVMFSMLLMAISSMAMHAQETYLPMDSTRRAVYSMQIEYKHLQLGGMGVFIEEDGEVKSSLINEFGVSLMDFTYNPEKDKLKLQYVLQAMNKWYLKRVLKKDLKKVLRAMRDGDSIYYNDKQKLKYSFTPVKGIIRKDTISNQ